MLNLDWITSATELLLVFLATSILILYFQYRQRYNYWKQLGVQQLNPVFPIGDLSWSAFGIYSVYERLHELHNEFKRRKLRFGGIYFFNGPVFMPIETNMIKAILTADFHYFSDRGLYIDKENLPISAHLSSMKGQDWKNIRMKFTPIFTSGKLKNMFSILLQNVDNLINLLNQYENGADLDMKHKFVCLTTDIVGNIALGLDCNSLKYPDGEFPRMVSKIFNPSNWELVKLVVQEGVQNPGNIMKTAYSKDVVNFFTKLVHDTVEYRETNNISRNDFMDMLLKLKQNNKMTMNEILAQTFLFFIGGFETSSSTMSYAIHELAYHQDIQDRARKEILDNLGRDVSKYTYDKISNLPYLDKIIKETLRRNPVLGMLPRIIVKPYKIPDTNIVLQPGTPVIVSLFGLHHDPDFFPDPLKFDPERFNSENLSSIVPYSYLPFGEGPRNCIGMRLAMMQMKLGLAGVLSNFKFLPGKGSTRELQMNPSTTAIVVTVKNGVPVKLIKV